MGFTRTRSLSQTTGKGAGNDRAPRIDQIVDLFVPKPGKFYTMRLVGPMFSYGSHWFEINKKDGGQAKFSKECLSWNDEIEAVDSDRPCPYCDLDEKGRPQVHYYQNVIIRDLQEKAPSDTSVTKEERKSGFKDKESDSWTPVRVLRVPPSSVANLREMSELNKHGKKGAKKAYPIEDEEFGCDVIYKYKPEESGGAKHQFQKGDPAPLSEEEQSFLLWNTESMVEPEDLKTAKEEAKRLKPRLVGAEETDEDEEEEEDDYPKKKKDSGKKGAASKKPNFDDEDEDEDDEDEDDAPPKKSSKSKAKPKDEDEDEDDEDDEEEDEPPKKSSKSKVTKKPSKFDDDDEDEDEDDAPPKKSSKVNKFTPSVGDKVKVTDEDDEEVVGKVTNIKGNLISVKDEDGDTHRFNLNDVTVKAASKAKPKDEDEDDEDEDEPPKKSSKSKAKPKDEDEDDEDEDEPPKKSSKSKAKPKDEDEDDDEDEDEPPKKSSKPKVTKKSSKFDDDDEDEDD